MGYTTLTSAGPALGRGRDLGTCIAECNTWVKPHTIERHAKTTLAMLKIRDWGVLLRTHELGSESVTKKMSLLMPLQLA